ncbi:hypothetical protein [Puniceicoccus vermicola]|uniref:Uncharacterized protein n=1 Tax=Puniceicoccus vermicola TaxID=388746 RepID=A0A7X1AZX1_9BACT|nr:hypothetical protein [Puniceicoccus vermicola]MBC2602987.1 hypothetical protein [Puniceicoccus vermicola]
MFINCPFDDDYWDLFRAIVFTVIRLRFNPRFSLERADSGEARINKIFDLVKDSKFGIHDLSRCKAKKVGEIFRLNMPLELGIDLGAKYLGTQNHREKKILIVEEERYRFQAAISDLSNSDIKSHGGEPIEVVRIVRNWLVQEGNATPKSPTEIWYELNDCLAAIFDQLKKEGYSDRDIRTFPENELTNRMIQWVERAGNTRPRGQIQI